MPRCIHRDPQQRLPIVRERHLSKPFGRRGYSRKWTSVTIWLDRTGMYFAHEKVCSKLIASVHRYSAYATEWQTTLHDDSTLDEPIYRANCDMNLSRLPHHCTLRLISQVTELSRSIGL